LLSLGIHSKTTNESEPDQHQTCVGENMIPEIILHKEVVMSNRLSHLHQLYQITCLSSHLASACKGLFLYLQDP